jgi:uncharacterized protein YbjT (DUF2867 family)
MKKIILVTGATGAEGGSVAKALLATRNFSVRVLVKDPSLPRAMALQTAGAILITGSLDDKESLRTAMKDCYGVFGVTNFWEHNEKEYQQGKNLIDAVKAAAIQHFVFHTLPDYQTLSGGQYSVPRSEVKAALEAYARLLNVRATFARVSFYYEHVLSFLPLERTGENEYYFGLPQGNSKLAMVSVEDLGAMVNTLFNHPEDYIGKTITAVGADKTGVQYAAIMTKVLRKNIEYRHITREEYAALDVPNATEMANMFEVQRLHIPNRQLDLIESIGLNPALQSFETWLIKNRTAFENKMRPEEFIPV